MPKTGEMAHYMHYNGRTEEYLAIDISQNCTPEAIQKAIDFLEALRDAGAGPSAPQSVH